MSSLGPGKCDIDLNHTIHVLLDPEAEFEWDEAWDCLKSIGAKDQNQAPMLKEILRTEYENNHGEFVQLFSLRALKRMGVYPDDIYADLLRLAKTGREPLLRIESAKEISLSSKDRDVRISDLCTIINTNEDKSINLRMSFFIVLVKLAGGIFKAMSALSNSKKSMAA